MLRLKNRAQFQAVLAERVIAKSEHFALHRHPLGRGGAIQVKRSAALADNAPAMQPASAVLESLPASSKPHLDRPLFSPVGLWLGAMVPKRWAKRSVTRHAIKRQIYEVAQSMLPLEDQAAYVVRLRSGFSREVFHSSTSTELKQAVRAELHRLMARLQRPA